MPQITDTMFQSVQDDASRLRISAIGSVLDVTNTDAADFRTSAIQGDAALQRVSAFQTDAGNFDISAKSLDAGTLLVSAKQGDAALLRVSAQNFPDTTGALTIFKNLNLSSAINVKATAASVHGWHAWNSDTKPNYINLYNVSGAISVGTDVPLIKISLAASGRSDNFFSMGLAGFTNGISIASVSSVLDTATTGGTASAVGMDLFYK